MPKPPKAVHAGRAKRRIVSSGSASPLASSRRATESPRGQHSAGKLHLYEILYTLNQGLEQVLGQLQQLEKFGLRRQAWKAFQVMVEETRAEGSTSTGRAARGARTEGLDALWLRHQREKKYRDPQDVLLEADRLRQQMKKRRARRRGTPQE